MTNLALMAGLMRFYDDSW